MMKILRLLPLAVAVALVSAASPALHARQQQNNQQQQQRTPQEQRDIAMLVQTVDAVASGKQPAPADISVSWDSNHFVRGGDGSTYIPFTLSINASQLAMPTSSVYVRVMTKEQVAAAVAAASATAAPAAEQNNNRGRNQPPPPARVVYAWDNIYFTDIKPDGKLSRPMALKPGQYEVFVALKEKATGNAPAANAPAPKIGLMRHELDVPDFNLPDLSTSSIIIADVIEPIPAPLSAREQQENPYTFGAMKVVPSPGLKLKKAGELQVLFWIYGTQQNAGKPDILVEYNFHQKTADGEKYFNKTAPQPLNAETLPPQFDLAMGHQLPGSLVVPLMSFPVGDYRLEIKITDKVSGKTLTQNATFTVEA